MISYLNLFSKENNFSSLFFRIWIKLHFPLISPITYLFQVIIKFSCWFMYVINLWKEGCVTRKYFAQWIYSIRKIIYVYWKQNWSSTDPCRIADFTFLHSYVRAFETTPCSQLSRLFSSFWVTKEVHLQHHKLLT